MKKALSKALAVAGTALGVLFSAALWIVILFIGGAGLIANGVLLMFGPGAAFMVAGVFMLAACFLLKKAVTDG